MFDKVSQAAEKVATNVSRRAFLGRLGQGALATAGVLMLTTAGPAQARGGKTCCHYQCGLRTAFMCVDGSVFCPPLGGCTLRSSNKVGNCGKCT